MLSSHRHHHHPFTFLCNHSLFQKVTLSYKQIEQQMSDLSFLTTTDLTKPYIFNPKIDTHSGFEFSIQSLLEWFGSTKEILNETLPPTIHARYVGACCCVLLRVSFCVFSFGVFFGSSFVCIACVPLIHRIHFSMSRSLGTPVCCSRWERL